MKQYLRFTLLLFLTLFIMGGKAFADDTAYKTLTFPPDSYSKALSAYDETWTATIGADNWSIYAFTNNKGFVNDWTYIRCGHNKTAYKAYILNSNTFDKAISKVVVTIGAISASKVSGIYLQVCSDASCKNILSTTKILSPGKGDNVFNIDTSSQSPSNYYKLVFDCKVGGGSTNGFLQVSKVAYYAVEDARTATTTTFADVTESTITSTVNQAFTATASVKANDTAVDDATVTYKSSNEKVATVDENGNVTTLTPGTTVITATYAGDDTYTQSAASFTLTVTYASELTEIFNASDTDIDGQGASGGGEAIVADRANIAFNASSAYKSTSNNYVQIYGGSSITLTAKEGYVICGVKLTANTANNIKTWKDQDDNSLTISEAEATWSGIGTSVVITNAESTLAQLTSIEVSYIKLTESDKTVTIGEDGKATYCAEADCIVGDGTMTKYITGTEDNGTTLKEVSAPILAEGEGVLLNGAKGTYKVYTHSLLKATKNANNKLVGCTEATTVPTYAYVMQKQNNSVAFYLVTESTNITCPAGKAYLSALSSEAKALFFVDGETTGIDSVEISNEETTGDIYTLSGVKVNKANLTKGIYIVNGKKYIVK